MFLKNVGRNKSIKIFRARVPPIEHVHFRAANSGRFRDAGRLSVIGDLTLLGRRKSSESICVRQRGLGGDG